MNEEFDAYIEQIEHARAERAARVAAKGYGSNRPDRHKLPHLETAAQLLNQEFDPLSWIVPRYVPEGLTMLAGKPKVGKSWLMLATALAVARGRTVLDQACAQRSVLYYALEDTRRRMKDRILKIVGDDRDALDNLAFRYELPLLENGGMTQLQSDADAVKPGFTIIDTLGRVRGSRKTTENEYQCDTRNMALLHNFAKKNNASLLAVHHLRKQGADDEFDTISGTHGLTGVADTLCILTRLQQDLRLIIRGRDVDFEDKIVDADLEAGVFNVTGDFEGKDPASADTKARILDALEAHHPRSLKPADIAKLLNLPAPTVRKALSRMNQDGKILRAPGGSYHL